MHICQTRRTLMMVKPPPPYSFLPQSLVHFLFLCLFSTFSIFNRPWENFSRDQEEKSALIATGSVDWNLGRFPLLNWACQLWPALPRGSWRSSALWHRSLQCSTPTPPLGSDTKNQGCRFFLMLMRHTSWGFFFLPLQAISSYNTLRACFQFQAKENEFQKHFKNSKVRRGVINCVWWCAPHY